jgi:hypothetical protein
MAGVKQTWKAIIGSIRSTIVHQYEGNACVGVVPRVRMVVLISEGREEGRLIVTDMTVEEAEQRIQELSDAVKVARSSDFYTPASN